MFSRREREYLRSLAQAGPRRGLVDFANLGYRRKLRWSVRRKATAALDDWELLAEAARAEPRLLASVVPEAGASVPVHAEPLAAAVRYVARRLRRPRASIDGDHGPGRGR